jgi:hypothetical protein
MDPKDIDWLCGEYEPPVDLYTVLVRTPERILQVPSRLLTLDNLIAAIDNS